MRHRVTGTFEGKPAEVLWFDGVMHGPDKLLDQIGENASQEIFYGPVPVQIVAPLLTLEEDAGILIEAAFDTVEFSTFDARIHESEVEVEKPVEKHYGPDDHPSGTPQSVHGPGLQDPRHFTDDPAGGPRGRTMIGTKQILESWLKEKSFTYEDRITFTMEEADEAYLKDPKKFLANSKWYVTEAQAGAKRIAKKYDFSLEDASFFIAVSSPNHQWEINERVAGQIAKLFRDNEDTIKAMAADGVDPKKIWAAVKSQWDGQYGFSGYNNDYGPKAVRVFLGESIDNVLSGTKVRSFWNNIMFPNQKTAVTIDGWMANVIGGDPFGELKGAKSILTPKIPGGSSIGWKAIGGTYNFFGSVLEQSTERFNEKHGTSLLPHEFQASLWMYWKNEKFTPEEKSRRTKAKNK